MPFNQLSAMLTSGITIILYQNHKINLDVVNRTQILQVIHVLICVYVCVALCNIITHVALCIYHE